MNRIFLLLMLVNVPGFFYGQAAPFTTPPESLLLYNTSHNFDIIPGFFTGVETNVENTKLWRGMENTFQL